MTDAVVCSIIGKRGVLEAVLSDVFVKEEHLDRLARRWYEPGS
jgi:hypothetical protein